MKRKDNLGSEMKKNNLVKILIPIAMVAIVVGIWFFQSGDTMEAGEGDFVLNVTDLDVEGMMEQKLPIIIDFGADACEPCKAMAPVLVTVNEQMQGKAFIKFVDVWKNPQAADGYPIQLIPTQLFINADGTPYIPSEEVYNINGFTMYGNNETGEHYYTVHEGALTEDQMNMILADMGVV